MSFDERYRLLELAGDEGAKTFVAQEISTGKKVTVFLFVGEQARTQFELLIQLRSVDRAQLPEMIETGDNRGTPYVVTEPIGSLAELKSRLSRVPPAQQEAPAHKTGEFSKAGVWHVPVELHSSKEAETKSPEDSISADLHETIQPSAPSAPDSFEQMFQAPAAPIGESALEAPKAPAPPVEPPPPPPPAPAPGSFTQMFRAAAAPIGEPVPEAPKAPAPPVEPPPPPAPAPGSFTQMFRAAAAPIGEPALQASKTPPPAVLPKPAQSGPGEFTRFFKAAASSSPSPAPVPQKTESQGQGEFARLFGSGDRMTAPPSTGTGIFGQSPSAAAPKQNQIIPVPAPPPSFAKPAGEFTKIFGDTDTGMQTPGPMAAQTPAPSPTPPPPARAPGEYTRMFGAHSFTQEPLTEPAPIAAPEAPVPAKRPSKMIPVLIGITLLLLAAIAVIVITMRK